MIQPRSEVGIHLLAPAADERLVARVVAGPGERQHLVDAGANAA